MSTEESLRQRLNRKPKLVVRTSRRITKDENCDEKGGISNRENRSKWNLKKNVNFERGNGDNKFYEERGKFRALDGNGRNKRVYGNDGIMDDESGRRRSRVWNGVAISQKKPLFKRGERKLRDEGVKGKGRIVVERTMWAPSKSRNGTGLKDKKENDVLVTAKEKTKGREVRRMRYVGMEDSESGSLKENIREKKTEFNKGKRQEENVSTLSYDKKNARDKAGFGDDGKTLDDQPKNKKVRGEVGLDADGETLDERPKRKKKKWLIKLDPYDISNKRLDDAVGTIEGSKEEKEVDSEKEPQMSMNAQFRAIQPSPSILSFVEKNLLGRRRMIDIKRAGYNIDLSAPLDNIPFSTRPERENIEENIFRNRLEFFAAAKVSSSFPPPDLPEIAFAGRSNVGKSSLLNALTRQWGVVRTSDKPGLTQTINFFNLGTKLCLVDLPGYGFAYAKEEVKEAWEDLVKEYVSTRVGLKRVCLLIDTKWGMKPRDHELIELMERSKTKYQIVLTKTDTVFPIDVARRAMQIEESLLQNKSVIQPLMMASSKSGAGIRSLRTVLANIARFVKI